jgi:hypothetical protein
MFTKDTEENRKDAADAKHRRGDVGVTDHTGRRTTIIDVRTCAESTSVPKDKSLVEAGEKDKHETYARRFDFPDGYNLIVMAIDTNGKIGEEFDSWMLKYCKRAATANGSFNHNLYNSLVNRYRSAIGVALARGVGEIIDEYIVDCVHERDRMLLCGFRCRR